MAETKFLDLEGLTYYHSKIKPSLDKISQLEQDIADLNYKKITINSMTATNVSNEIGATVTTTKVDWTLSKTPKTMKIKFGSEAEETLGADIRTKTYTGKSVTTNTNIVLNVTDERDAAVSRTVTISFQPKVYWGVSDDPNGLDSSTINGLSGALASSRARTINVNAGAGQYIVYIIPSSFGIPTFNVGGFDGGFKKVKTLNHTNASGHQQNYDVWQSVNAGLGSTAVVVK